MGYDKIKNLKVVFDCNVRVKECGIKRKRVEVVV